MILFMDLCESIQTCVNQRFDIFKLWTQEYIYLLTEMREYEGGMCAVT